MEDNRELSWRKASYSSNGGGNLSLRVDCPASSLPQPPQGSAT